MKDREQGAVRSKGIFIAIGVNLQGQREILGFQVGDGESYDAWSESFLSLKERGLSGVDFGVSDNHGGLVKAIREQFCGAIWQRCQTHFSLNMPDKIPKKHRPVVQTQLKDLYDSPDDEAVCQRRDTLLALLEPISSPSIARTVG